MRRIFTLVLQLTKINLLLRYRNAMLGFAWVVGDQLLFLLVMSVVFSALNQQPLATYVLYVFSGLLPWRFFEDVSMSSMESILGGKWLITQVPVSLFTFPLTQLCTGLADFGFALISGALIFAFVGFTFSISQLALPLSLLVWAGCAFGMACITSVAYTFVRDVKPIVRSMMMLLFFSSPILIMQSSFGPETLQSTLFRYHPITYLAHLFQKPLYWREFPALEDWLISFSIMLVLLLVGINSLHATRKKIYFVL